MKEVTGVIIFTHRMNAYWAQKFGEAGEDGNINKSPDCSSMDGKQGVNRETGEIRTCDTCLITSSDPTEKVKPARTCAAFTS